MRKLKKLLTKPHIYFRDALINKYPITLNKNNIKYNSEHEIINALQNINSEFSANFDIDVVYTWVDSKDSEWVNKKNLFLSKTINNTLYSTEESRFQNHNELYYSLLSIHKNIPWVRKIFIITDNQKPEIPEVIRHKTIIIKHNEIIPQKYLPTFNSHVIEAYLHNIDELSENFIYFNDDFFVARPLKSSHFFKSNGLASLFICDNDIDSMIASGHMTATLLAYKNCNLLFKEKLNTRFSRALTHTYVPLKKSFYKKAHQLFTEEIKAFSSNKFRSSNDLNLATFLVPYLQYHFQHALPALDICTYFNIRSPAATFFYKSLMAAKKDNRLPNSFCANDFSSVEFLNSKYSENLELFLHDFFEI